MPTADEFDQAAEVFVTAAERLPRLLTAVTATNDAIRGGALRAQLDQLCVEGRRAASTWHDDLLHAADTCRSRATTIRHIEEALRQFQLEQAVYESSLLAYAEAGADPSNLAAPIAPTPPNILPMPAWAELSDPTLRYR